MCGIAGLVDFEGAVEPDILQRMLAALEHRGPDEAGIYEEDGLALGARRLSIVDVAGGSQPLYNEDRSVVAVVNGEIYDFVRTRAQLEADGHRFATGSDAEVVVHLYEEHGDRLARHLRGMFALAVWDRRRRRLVLARDRVGKKPLFWARRGERVWFASELRALLQDGALRRHEDFRAIEAYLALGYVPHPLCAVQGVAKLPPASTLVLEAGFESEARYWQLDYRSKMSGIARAEVEERLRAALAEATRLRLIGEVPVGAFLSGGIDSSAVVAAMAEHSTEPVKTFSIGFSEDDWDETKHARTIAELFSTDHHEFRVEPAALDLMPVLARQYGEPFADASAIPSFYLAELTARHVTVALNGDGGDESFAGYGRYARSQRMDCARVLPQAVRAGLASIAGRLVARCPQASSAARAGRFAAGLVAEPLDFYLGATEIFRCGERASLLRPELTAEIDRQGFQDTLSERFHGVLADDPLERLLGFDVETYLPGDLLVKMDIATMAHSLEARSPFLDHELMELAAALPPDLKMRWGKGKGILKSALRNVLPEDIIKRPKMGFGVPLARWFRRELVELPQTVLLDPGAATAAYLRPGEVDRLLSEHRDGSADHAGRIYALLQLELWHREVLRPPDSQFRVDPSLRRGTRSSGR